MPDSTGGVAFVSTMSSGSTEEYEVTAAATASASCTCPQGQLQYMCKHIVKVTGLSTGFSDVQIIQALATRAGTNLEGFAHLHSNVPAQPQANSDPLAQLEDSFCLNSIEAETVAQADPKHAPSSEPVHDSAGRQQSDVVYNSV